MDHIPYQIFKYITKKPEILTCNSPIRIYVNRIENKITFRITFRKITFKNYIFTYKDIILNFKEPKR